VLLDKRVSASGRCVYALLAGTVFQGTVASVGQRRIAELLGFSKNTVNEAVKELATFGHVQVVKNGAQRYRYHLTSGLFGQKQRALDAGEATVEELVSSPRPRLATVRKTA
jgi:predicted transcriptional regulator